MPEGTRSTEKRGARLRSLDGVRGIAAIVVVIYHVSLIAKPFAAGGTAEVVWDGVTESPLKLLFAGTEAVLVFFVLSGLVVALPLLRHSVSWPAFFASRLVRLYVPVWGALLFAVALIAVFPRHPSAVTSDEWISDANASSVTIASFFREASLTPASYDIVNTLWSLRWELIFTALLPVLIGIALLLRRSTVALVVTGAAAVIATMLGRVLSIDALVYLPVFLLGTLVAVRLEEIIEWAHRRTRPVLWTVVGSSSALLLVASWIGRPLTQGDDLLSEVLWGLAGLGALGIVLVSICSPGVERALSTRIPQWAGKISFSLYLVHVPVLATIAFLVGDRLWWVVGLVGVPLSLAIAAGFFALVERPSHRLARATGGGVTRLVERFRGRRGVSERAVGLTTGGAPAAWSAPGPLGGHEPTPASPLPDRTDAQTAPRSGASDRVRRREG
ncbi:peptidoglycan/LPS O-acetylase OafA/YrhL [Labedella gwakjiensis]|uniref:Acyltransferase n=1 Tax=Labedella gwakjiensis TaxID=390269 RepID=A0A2P8GUX7_9MICO|nr:peptidoglycan/LPS O-acetylase OafA/YrhL [Labedella gwakjiensis]RUQ87658.1 acyltransferase [Labedella gwakjiensis]